jgi:hypothetical protein
MTDTAGQGQTSEKALRHRHISAWPFVLAISLSAFKLFAVQPIK